MRDREASMYVLEGGNIPDAEYWIINKTQVAISHNNLKCSFASFTVASQFFGRASLMFNTRAAEMETLKTQTKSF